MAHKNKPISPQQLAQLAQYGRGGDTMLAHINPEEAEMLKRMGGSGTINPHTGLPEFAIDLGLHWNMADSGFGGGDFSDFSDFNDYGGSSFGTDYNVVNDGGFGGFGDTYSIPIDTTNTATPIGGGTNFVVDTGGGTTSILPGVPLWTAPDTSTVTPTTDSTVTSVAPVTTDFGDVDISSITNWTPTYGTGTQVADISSLPTTSTSTVTDTGPVVPGLTTSGTGTDLTTDTSTTGSTSPFVVDVRGAAGTADAPQYVTGTLTPGSILATADQVDAGQATFNSASNAWEVKLPAAGSLDAGPAAVTLPTGGVYDILGNTASTVVPDLGPWTPLNVTPGNIGNWYTNAGVSNTTVTTTPTVISNMDFSGTTANLFGGPGTGSDLTLSNVILGDATVSGPVTPSNIGNVTLSNVTGGNVVGNNATITPGTSNVSVFDSTYGNISNITSTTNNLSVINSINDSIQNATSNLTNANIANTFSNTINNVISNMSNINISNANVNNISNSISNIANANITDTQANTISNVISIITNSNIANANAGSIFNAVSNIANSNISNTVVNNVSNVISNIANSNISNTIANTITNSISTLSNVVISNSTANLVQNVASNLANVIVSNTSGNVGNLVTTLGNANGNITITANTLANANVVANVISNVIANSNANVNTITIIANTLSNANVIANVLTNANVISNVLTNANVVANVLTNANVVANVLTNANVVANVLTNANVVTNVISNVANVVSNVANVANVTGNVTLGTGLNPGYMAPTAFYNTYNPAQSKFFWGQHGFQEGPKFNEVLYNQAAAPNTPWGLQQVATPLTSQQINDIVMGRNVTQPVSPVATRREQYQPGPVAPSYGQRKLEPKITNQPATNVAYSPSTTYNNPELARQLGPNWFNKQQAAANAGDWDTYFAIQKQVDQILNPVIDRP